MTDTGWTLERRQALGATIDALLSIYSPFGVALYLTNTFTDLDRQTPLWVLQHGDVDRVLGVVEAMKRADW